MKVCGFDCVRDKKVFGCQFNDTEFNKKIGSLLAPIRSNTKYVDYYGNIISLDFLKFTGFLFEKEVIYVRGTWGGPEPNPRIYYIIFDENTQMYFLVSFYKPYHDSRLPNPPKNHYQIHLIIESPKYDFDVVKQYLSVKFYNFNYKTDTTDHLAEVDNFYKAVVEAFQYLNLIHNFESSKKKIKELEYLSKENVQIKKSLDSKVKLIEELKKKCKKSITNSLPRKSKKTFKPKLHTIPNTKTRNSRLAFSKLGLSKSRKSHTRE